MREEFRASTQVTSIHSDQWFKIAVPRESSDSEKSI